MKCCVDGVWLVSSIIDNDNCTSPLSFPGKDRRCWLPVLVMIALAVAITGVGGSYVWVSLKRSVAHPTTSDLAESWRNARYLILEVYDVDGSGNPDVSAILSSDSADDAIGGVLVNRCVVFDRRDIERTSRMLEKFRYGREDVAWAPSRIIAVYMVGGPESASQRSRISALYIDGLPTVFAGRDGRLFEFHCDDPAAREWFQELYVIAQTSRQLE